MKRYTKEIVKIDGLIAPSINFAEMLFGLNQNILRSEYTYFKLKTGTTDYSRTVEMNDSEYMLEISENNHSDLLSKFNRFDY